VRRAGPDALGALSGLSARLAAIEGLTEERPGAFHRSVRSVLHFQEDESGLDVDVRLQGEARFSRSGVSDGLEQDALFTRVKEALGARVPGR
jgi:hypothetical protein